MEDARRSPKEGIILSAAVPAIWLIADRICNSYGIKGGEMPKNSWSYTTSDDEITVVEDAFSDFELRWNGKPIASATHPASLIRKAYEMNLIDLSKAKILADALGVDYCHFLDNDR